MINRKYLTIFLAIVILSMHGCKSANIYDASNTGSETDNKQKFEFKNSKCKDYLVNLSSGSLSYLSNLWLLDHKPILKITDLPTSAPRGIAVNDGDMQLANYGGTIQGWINLLDENRNIIATDIKMEIRIYEWTNLIGKRKRLVFSTSRNFLKNDFKLITYEDKKNTEENQIVALHINDIKLENFDIQPNECFGEIQINYTNSEDYKFSSTALTLFTDLEEIKIR